MFNASSILLQTEITFLHEEQLQLYISANYALSLYVQNPYNHKLHLSHCYAPLCLLCSQSVHAETV